MVDVGLFDVGGVWWLCMQLIVFCYGFMCESSSLNLSVIMMVLVVWLNQCLFCIYQWCGCVDDSVMVIRLYYFVLIRKISSSVSFLKGKDVLVGKKVVNMLVQVMVVFGLLIWVIRFSYRDWWDMDGDVLCCVMLFVIKGVCVLCQMCQFMQVR